MDFNFTCNFLTCSVTVLSTEQDMLTLPEHLMSPRVRFFVDVHTASASVFVSSYSCTSLFSVLCCFCVPVPFVVFMCVISSLPCLWIQSFFNNSFTLFLWYSVADTWTFLQAYQYIFCNRGYFSNVLGARVAQWVRSLDLTAHTRLSPIRRGFASSFVNYKKGVLDLQPQVIKFTSCLSRVGSSLQVLRLPPPLKLVAMI
jgi:hypothetical protein